MNLTEHELGVKSERITISCRYRYQDLRFLFTPASCFEPPIEVHTFLTSGIAVMGLNRESHDERKCHLYGRFMEKVSQGGDNATFWVLFVFNILILCVAACCLASYDNHKKHVLFSFLVNWPEC
jgi:hypothetical protein